MGHDIDMGWLADYFAGELSEEDAEALEAWIQEDPERRARARTLQRIWEAAGQAPLSQERDADAMWNRLSERMENTPEDRQTSCRRQEPRSFSHGADTERADTERSGAEERRPARPHRSTRQRRRRSRHHSWRAAAGAALLLLGAVAIFFVFGEEAPAMREVATEAGQRTRVQLGDGTQVVLNAKSTLRLPKGGFADRRRQVRLQGEAYFEVTPDAGRPFIVRTGKATMRVLGTAFDVRAYPDDETVQVTVAEGKVAARAEGAEDPAKDSSEVVLGARQTGRLSGQAAPVVQSGVDVTAELAWQEGRLVFQDAPLEEVARKLERWYGLRVELGGRAEAVADRLNATFEGESVEEILSVTAKTLGLHYEREGKTVRFLPRGSSSPR